MISKYRLLKLFLTLILLLGVYFKLENIKNQSVITNHVVIGSLAQEKSNSSVGLDKTVLIEQTAPILKKETKDVLKKENNKVTQPDNKNLATKSIMSIIATSTQVDEQVNKPNTDFSKINEDTRKALVNILCSTKSAGTISPITGSGVIISKDGVIITNAHIAQYLLLKDFNGQKDFIQCIVRIGSPAYPTYRAKLVYISPDWIENNKTILIDKNPLGTGEHDYAFLKITEKIDNTNLPTEFPFITVSTDENINIGDPVLLASYPAGFLGGIAILQYLYQSSAEAKITDRFTFKENTVDLISIAGTIISQKGSSGGAVVNGNGEFIGLISTSADALETNQRSGTE